MRDLEEWIDLPVTETEYPEEVKLFHITSKGLEENLLFFDDDDYLKIINISAVCAFCCNVSILAFSHMSNHSHYVVACTDISHAERFMNRSKRMYSFYMESKRKICNIQKRAATTIKEIGDLAYLRRCIAYVLRNPVEAKVVKHADQYRWSSYNCYFSQGIDPSSNNVKAARDFRKRELMDILGTHSDLTRSDLILDRQGNVIPMSFVAFKLVEDIFGQSIDNMVRHIMKINYFAMEFELTFNGNEGISDLQLAGIAQQLSKDWFGTELSLLALDKRIKLVDILFRKHKATRTQICRALNIPRKVIREIIP